MVSGQVFGKISAVLWSGLGLLLGRLWRSWEALGLSWDVLGGFWALLEVSWALLGSSGALLGAKLEPRWSPKGATSTPRPPKIEAKTVQDSLDM